MTATADFKARLLRNVGWNYLAGLANMVSLIVLYPFAVRAAGVGPYGVWMIGFGFIQFLLIADMGLATGAVRYISVKVAHGAVRSSLSSVFGSVVLLFSIMGVLLGVACFLSLYYFFDHTSAASSLSGFQVMFLLCLSALALLLGFVGRGAVAVFWGLNHYDLERKFAVVAVALRAVGIFGALYLDLGVLFVASIEAASVVLPGLACLFICMFRLECTVPSMKVLREIIPDLFGFGSKAFVGAFTGAAAVQVPNLILGAVLGPTSVVAYNALLRTYMAGRACLSWIASPSLNLLIRVYEKDGEVRHRLYSRFVLCVCLGVGAGIGWPLAVLPYELVTLWLGEGHEMVSQGFPVLGLCMLLSAVVLASTSRANSRGFAGAVAVGGIVYLVCAVVGTGLAAELGYEALALVVPFGAIAVSVPIFLLAGRFRDGGLGSMLVDSLLVATSIALWAVASAVCRWVLGPVALSDFGVAIVLFVYVSVLVVLGVVGFYVFRQRPGLLSRAASALENV